MLPAFIVAAIKIGVVLLGAGGATAGAHGVAKIKKAKRIGQNAQKRHNRAISGIHSRRNQVTERARSYGHYLLRLEQGTLTEMADLLEALQKKARIGALKIPKSAEIQVRTLKEFKQRVLDPPQDAAGVIGVVGTGAAASSSTLGLVGLLGTASTGTAISSLSGAAATNATLAWLGGGPLAAGGGGVAAGTLVLSGITVAPTLVVGGFYLASKGEKALTEARRYEKSCNTQVAKLNTLGEFLKKLEWRIEEFQDLAKKLNRRARYAMAKIDPATFNPTDDAAVTDLTTALQLVRALSEVIRTPLVSQNGNLSVASHKVYLKYEELARD